MKVIIIGGGIGGLSLAKGLESNGYEVCLYESAQAFKPVGAGLALSPNAMYSLGLLGLKEIVKSVSFPYLAASMRKQNGNFISQMNMNDIVSVVGESFITLHRHDLHSVLSGALQSTKVFFNKKCESIQQNEHGVKVTFTDGSTNEGDYLIAADGIHSVVRKQLLPDVSERFSGQTCWRGICSNENINYKQLSETWGKGIRFGIVPITNNRLYWFAVLDANKEKEFAHVSKNELLKMYADFHEPVVEVIQQTDESQIYWNDLNDLLPIKNYAFERVLLIGDAAHATTPNMGQGACMAIEDAALLHVLTKDKKDLKEVFVDFQNKRIKRCTDIVNQSYQFGKMTQWTNPILIFLRNTLLKHTPKSVLIKNYKSLFGYKVGEVK